MGIYNQPNWTGYNLMASDNLFTESYATLKSTKMRCVSMPYSRNFSIACLMVNIWFMIDFPPLQPAW